jgi:hypothetical protein
MRRIASQRRTTMKAKGTLFVAVALSALAFAGEAKAQASFGGASIFTGKFTLPYEVHWGKAVLQPGEYVINMSSAHSMASVWSADGKRAVFLPPPILDDSAKGPTELTVTIRGHERTVTSLNVPGMGYSFTYKPLTKTDRELLAETGQAQAVPVTTARK